MSTHDPLNALAAELGEETVLQMAISYINAIMDRRAGIAPASWSPVTPPRLARLARLAHLARRTMAASADNLHDLEDEIVIAHQDGLSQSEEYIDALSRLDALRAVNEMADR